MKILKNMLTGCHFVIIKLFYWNRFRTKKLSLFSWRAKVKIGKQGNILFSGKVSLSEFCELHAIGNIQLGNRVYINKYSRIIAFGNIEIGNNVLIAQFVTILDHDHKYVYDNNEIQFDGYNVAPIIIGNNVLIGDKVTILKGSVIGDNVIIGANSLVKGVIPSNSMVFGPLAQAHISDLNSHQI